ncbi:hypothetical protein [Mesorhizobium sp. B2-3-4]|uniref:hypothetical protein n=1 Tax=Mesorhizobium sp. B2-3-4 TaxID=2589959 RepID=UPI001FEF7FAB|nr:hypothetical protein [Mesorhizobium sp. B2-3-4]
MKWPSDIDQIATDIVRAQFGPDTDADWEQYKLIANALLAERARPRFEAIVSLSQDELDDAYHLAMFDCDEELAKAVRQIFKLREEQMIARGVPRTLWNTIRDDFHNILSSAFNGQEIRRLGAARYNALLARLMARDPENPVRPV